MTVFPISLCPHTAYNVVSDVRVILSLALYKGLVWSLDLLQPKNILLLLSGMYEVTTAVSFEYIF